MRRCALFAIILACAGAGHAMAAEADKPPAVSVARITSTIPEGRAWGSVIQRDLVLGCSSFNLGERIPPLLWGTGIGRLNLRALEQPTRVGLKKLGFPIAGDVTDPFAEETAGDFSIGGTITDLKSVFCYPDMKDADRLAGSTSIEIDWQVYSTVERRVIAKVHTAGLYKTDANIHGGFQAIVFNALDDSLAKLAASKDFQEAIRQRTGASATASSTPDKTPLVLAGAKTAGPARIPDAVGSVVLILSGGGHGSGFLVSADGYVMTAEHVVGSDKYVKIRWSDGLEGVGEVIRTDKRRDVAILKTDPRGRRPLALRRDAPQPGDSVFAIGAPIDPKLQNTVTRGVVSASSRIMDGFSFIQSDVTVDPGNSGGPLLDEQGRVLGFTDVGIRTREAPTGLNFFVPIDDALRFLSAEPQ